MVFSRDRTVTVKKSDGVVPDFSSFCDLVESGVFGDVKAVRQVVKYGDEFHVSFVSHEVMMDVAKSFRREVQDLGMFFLDPVDLKRSYVKVYDLPYEVPSDSIIKAFSEFGKVGEITRDKFPGRPFWNGIRTVPIFLNEEAVLPETIVIEGFCARVMNTSAVHCSLCKKNGHAKKDCPDLICNRCGEWGHFANRCPTAFCSRCNIHGHWTKQCRVGIVGEKDHGKGKGKGKGPAKKGNDTGKGLVTSGTKPSYAQATKSPALPPGVPSTSTVGYGPSADVDSSRKRPRTYVPSERDVAVAGVSQSPRDRPQPPLATHNRIAGFSNDGSADDVDNVDEQELMEQEQSNSFDDGVHT